MKSRDSASAGRAPRSGGAWSLAWCVPAAAFVWLVVRLWRFTVDDTFITLRYARHLAAGLGPVWNSGPVHDEGYTSVLWMTVLAAPHAMGLDGELAAKVLSVLAQLGAIAACFALARAGVRALWPAAGSIWAGCAAALYALHPFAAVHAVSGMETAAFTCALTALAVAAAAALGSEGGLRPWRIALLALATGLLRPEGNVAALVLLGATLAMLGAAGRARLVRAVLLGYLLPGAVYFMWRHAYHGEWLPLPFYVKVADAPMLAGLARVSGFLAELCMLIGVPLAIGLVALPRVLVPAVAGAVALIVCELFPEHLMGFQARYLMPAAPVAFAIAGAGLLRLHTWFVAAPSRARLASPALAALVLVCGAAILALAPATIANRLLYADGLDRAHRVLARDLASVPPGRLAMSDAGVVPYRTNWPTLDLTGLNDRQTAVTRTHDPAAVLAFAPDVIVLASQEADRVRPFAWNAYESSLAAAAGDAGFRLVRRYAFHDGYWLWLLARPGSPTGDALLSSRSRAPASGRAAPLH